MLSKVVSLVELSCSQICNLEKETEDSEKGKVGDRPAKLNEKKGDRAWAREKKKKTFFSVEERHENFVAAVRKWEMLPATKVKMSGSEKELIKNTYDISFSKRVTTKFLEVSRCGRTKQRQRNVQKKCAARAKLLFC